MSFGPVHAEEKTARFVNESAVSSQKFRFLDGWADQSGRIKIRTGKVPFTRLANFVDATEDYVSSAGIVPSKSFRVLSIPRVNRSHFKIWLPQSSFEHIRGSWQLHNLTLESMIYNNGIFVNFCGPTSATILVKVANSKMTGLDAASISYDNQRRITHILYYGLTDEDSIFKMLENSPEHCQLPAFFVAVLFRSHQHQIERQRRSIDLAILETERKTGFGIAGMLENDRHSKDEQHSVNYKQIIQRLSNCQTDLVILGHGARNCLQCGDWLIDMLEKNLKLSPDWQSATTSCTKEELQLLQTVLQDVEYVRRRATAVISQMQMLKGRADSQTTLMLNMIAQNEAEYSASLAADSKRDSTAMKAIAIITTVFLPATFLATFFSMSMFDWDANNSSSPKVSKYIWVYWVIAIPMTVVVMFLWVWLSRLENRNPVKRSRRVNERLEEESKEPNILNAL